MRKTLIALASAALLSGTTAAMTQSTAPGTPAPGTSKPYPEASGTSERGRAAPGDQAGPEAGARSTTGPNATPPGRMGASQAATTETFVTAGDDMVLADKLEGVEIRNNNGDTIGEIQDVAVSGGKLVGYIVSVGGFLGIGENYVIVNPEAVTLTFAEDSKTWTAKMDAAREAITNAPKFKYEGRWAN